MNGEEITDNEVEHAQIFYSGILDQDYLLKSYSSEKVLSLSELTLTNSSLRQVRFFQFYFIQYTCFDQSNFLKE